MSPKEYSSKEEEEASVTKKIVMSPISATEEGKIRGIYLY